MKQKAKCGVCNRNLNIEIEAKTITAQMLAGYECSVAQGHIGGAPVKLVNAFSEEHNENVKALKEAYYKAVNKSDFIAKHLGLVIEEGDDGYEDITK